jgi:exo-beta-1,3-glucanase (GH17 family)
MKHLLFASSLSLILAACGTTDKSDSSAPETAFEKRDFSPTLDGKWIGNGISYGAYRDGENPDDHITSRDHIKEDMDIMALRWNLIRLYGSDDQAENILETIAQHNLPIRVMQGIWLDAHKSKEVNEKQVETAIRLANKYPEIIQAVNVGNEIFVDWSHHRIDDMDSVIDKIRKVRSSIAQPVTVADDYNFWNKPHAQKVADELDFICLHAYAFWNNKTINISMEWTVDIYNQIQGFHPGHKIAYCETGWPTSRIYNDGSYEGGLIGKANEVNQEIFFDEYNAWVEKNDIISFYFSSFDENWKGGMDGENPMDKAEKHWGLYFSDRTPKQALKN